MGLMKFAGVALRNLFSKPVTTLYPAAPAIYPERTRGHVELDTSKCILCSVCARHCPTGTIRVDRKAGTWTMERFDCVQCAACVNACPRSALSIVPGYFTPGVEKVTEVHQVREPLAEGAASKAAKPAAPAPLKPTPEKPAAAILRREDEAAGAKSVPMVGPACILCGACAGQCPGGAITVGDKWTLDEEKCLSCGACVGTCPVGALSMREAAPAAEGGAEAPAAAPQAGETAGEAAKEEPPKKTGRRVYVPRFDEDGEEIPVPACTKPDYVDLWADLPVSNPEKCVYCGLCARTCPKAAITVNRKEQYWEVDNAECVRCGICADTCPMKCITLPDVSFNPPVEEEEQDFIIACLEPGYNDQFTDLPRRGDGCIYCTLCARQCPAQALTVDRKAKTWVVDSAECVRCGVCASGCPKQCITLP